MNTLQRTLYRQIYRSLVQIQRDYLSQGVSVERAVASGIVRHDQNSQAVARFEAGILQLTRRCSNTSTRSMRAAVSARFRDPNGKLQDSFDWLRDGSDLHQAIGQLSASDAYTPQERCGVNNSGPLYVIGEVVHHCVHGPLLIYGWDCVGVATESLPDAGLVDNRLNFVGMDPQPRDGSPMPFYRSLSPDGFARYVREDHLNGYTEEKRAKLPTLVPPFQGSSFFFESVYLRKVALDGPAASAKSADQSDHNNHIGTPSSRAPSRIDVPVYIPTGALHKQYPNDTQHVFRKYDAVRSDLGLLRQQRAGDIKHHQRGASPPLAHGKTETETGRDDDNSSEQVLGTSLSCGDAATAAELAQELTKLKTARDSWVSKQERGARPHSPSPLPDMRYLEHKPGSRRTIFKIDDEG